MCPEVMVYFVVSVQEVVVFLAAEHFRAVAPITTEQAMHVRVPRMTQLKAAIANVSSKQRTLVPLAAKQAETAKPAAAEPATAEQTHAPSSDSSGAHKRSAPVAAWPTLAMSALPAAPAARFAELVSPAKSPPRKSARRGQPAPELWCAVSTESQGAASKRSTTRTDRESQRPVRGGLLQLQRSSDMCMRQAASPPATQGASVNTPQQVGQRGGGHAVAAARFVPGSRHLRAAQSATMLRAQSLGTVDLMSEDEYPPLTPTSTRSAPAASSALDSGEWSAAVRDHCPPVNARAVKVLAQRNAARLLRQRGQQPQARAQLQPAVQKRSTPRSLPRAQLKVAEQQHNTLLRSPSAQLKVARRQQSELRSLPRAQPKDNEQQRSSEPRVAVGAEQTRCHGCCAVVPVLVAEVQQLRDAVTTLQAEVAHLQTAEPSMFALRGGRSKFVDDEAAGPDDDSEDVTDSDSDASAPPDSPDEVSMDAAAHRQLDNERDAAADTERWWEVNIGQRSRADLYATTPCAPAHRSRSRADRGRGHGRHSRGNHARGRGRGRGRGSMPRLSHDDSWSPTGRGDDCAADASHPVLQPRRGDPVAAAIGVGTAMGEPGGSGGGGSSPLAPPDVADDNDEDDQERDPLEVDEDEVDIAPFLQCIQAPADQRKAAGILKRLFAVVCSALLLTTIRREHLISHLVARHTDAVFLCA